MLFDEFLDALDQVFQIAVVVGSYLLPYPEGLSPSCATELDRIFRLESERAAPVIGLALHLALRATQGCALAQANASEKAGIPGSTGLGIIVRGSFRSKIFQEKIKKGTF